MFPIDKNICNSSQLSSGVLVFLYERSNGVSILGFRQLIIGVKKNEKQMK